MSSGPLGYLGTPDASTTVKGKVELATVAETIAGTRTDLAITPFGAAGLITFGAPAAGVGVAGIIEIATNAEAAAKVATNVALVPSNIPSIMASPGAIGGTTPAAGNFTTLTFDTIVLTNPLDASEGGTGQSSYTIGDMLYATGATTLSKLAIGTARQLLQTNAGGTAPQWTSNVDIPGTLDVTSTGTFDAAVTIAGLLTGNASATLNTSGAVPLNLATNADTSSVNIGLGAARTINIGTSAATIATVNIGGTGANVIAIANTQTAGSLAIGNAMTTGTVTIGGATNTGTLTLGQSTAAGGQTINIGNAINTGAQIVNIAAGASAADSTVNILSGNATAGTITLNLATGNRAKAINIGNGVDGNTIAIGNGINTTAQTIHIANGNSAANTTVNIMSGTGTAGAGTLAIGNNTRVTVAGLCDIAPAANRTVTIGGGTVVVAATTDTIDIGPDGATTNADSVKTVNINTGGVTTGQVLTNIASGAVTSGTHTTSIASGNRAAGTMALNIMTGTGTKTMTVGNADGATTSTFLGPVNLNASQNSNTAINSGTSNGTVTIGNSAAGAITIDSASSISIDAAVASNFTVTGAAQDLTLSSSLGSVNVLATENAAQAVYIRANGGTSETVQLHADQGTAVNSIYLLSDVGGITLEATGLASADGINLTATAGGIDMDSALLTSITSTRDNAQAILVEATLGGIDIFASGASAGEDIDIVATGSSVNITSTEAIADAIVLNSSNAAGGIDLLTGGGEITINSGGNVTMAPATSSVAGTSLTINARVGVATFTGLTTAAAATETLTITNSALGAGDGVFCTVSNRGTNDAQMTLTRVNTQTAGSLVVQADNNGAAALNGDVIVTFWIIN